jgi:hypothetical protein
MRRRDILKSALAATTALAAPNIVAADLTRNWNMFFTFGGGTGNVSPASLTVIRCNPANAWFGWPDDPKMEARRPA